MRLFNLCAAIALAMPLLFYPVKISADVRPVTKITIGGAYVTTDSHKYNSIKPGDSVYDVALAEQKRKEDERKRVLRERTVSVENPDGAVVLYYDPVNGFNCVKFAQTKGFRGSGFHYARYIPVTSSVPIVGGFVVTYESWAGHIAWVREVVDNSIIVMDSNVKPGYITERKLSLRDNNLIKGFTSN